MKKAVIFDLDGTLANTIESLTYCGNRALRKFGLPEFEEADYKYFVGDGAAVLVRRALDKAGDTGLIHFQEVDSFNICRHDAKSTVFILTNSSSISWKSFLFLHLESYGLIVNPLFLIASIKLSIPTDL